MLLRHPNYYKNLRKLARNRDSHVRPISGSADFDTGQVISPMSDGSPRRRATGPGHKLQAREDSTAKRVAEPQASSAKLKDPQATSDKRQASSSKAQASSLKPQATSSLILDPRKSFKHPEPRCSSKINVLLGCFT